MHEIDTFSQNAPFSIIGKIQCITLFHICFSSAAFHVYNTDPQTVSKSSSSPSSLITPFRLQSWMHLTAKILNSSLHNHAQKQACKRTHSLSPPSEMSHCCWHTADGSHSSLLRILVHVLTNTRSNNKIAGHILQTDRNKCILLQKLFSRGFQNKSPKRNYCNLCMLNQWLWPWVQELNYTVRSMLK